MFQILIRLPEALSFQEDLLYNIHLHPVPVLPHVESTDRGPYIFQYHLYYQFHQISR